MMRKLTWLFITCFIIGITWSTTVDARTTQTDLSVHVISKGAKFIGNSMGGARVTITNVETGKQLSQGITRGTTGNTNRIMKENHGRNRVLSTDNAANFRTSIWLEEPTRIKITAFGPLAHKDDANTATVTTRILPGKDLTGGDGVLLEIPGFVVDIQSPTDNWYKGEKKTLRFRAYVAMLCGCPIQPGGLWDANDYEISVKLFENGELIKEVPMSYAGEPSQFEARLELPRPGCYEAVVEAHDPATGNTGFERIPCRLLN